MKRFIKSSIALSLLSISSLAFAQPVVLINTFSVDASKHEETLAYWESARDVLVQQPGYISTTLHRALSTDATYLYVNVANWESQKHFIDAISVMREELPALDLEGVTANPNLYEAIRN
ncbi:Antibiotic biosynthesis monooxygenase [Vibrio chagasii]|nr:Antibiotic biosynthesis monooxygenase [Vibrio chagasii]CAH6893782.1 Antibiotic biosynthesis monooxygenase [Vibrio chagasii]CAH6908890.1 Antibiotic biosynthesis monooxygenase [Vibrio chagasii]CAH6951967.1 Antibiotic biosynthesis monooxygenase [Vibrio chagasii]CAH7007462.1 Antibiotic biosynthesis monooxygenase [Vibrio chagasii]